MRATSGNRLGAARWVTFGALSLRGIGALAASALVAGCHLLSGLSDLSVGDSTGGGGDGGEGGNGAAGGDGGTGGSGGAGGTTTSSTATCNDGMKNGAETDADCGGPDCEDRCVLGRGCAVGSDCESGICRDEMCAGVTHLAAGNAHACALLSTKELFCWGQNARGQLGVGDTMMRDAPTEVEVAGATLADVVAGGPPIDKNTGHTCARTESGQVLCWGANEVGQLGLGTTDDQSAPAQVPMLAGVKALGAGGAFTCAIDGASALHCWGENGSGQLAVDIGAESSVPVSAPELASVTAVAAGSTHACALLPDGSAMCWGSNGSGQVGSDGAGNPAKPSAVSGISGVSALQGGLDATCAVNAAGLWCWGDNADSQLTDVVIAQATATPTDLMLAGVTSFALGSDGDDDANDPLGGHGCVVQGEKVACWGNNRKGQLGRGTVSDQETSAAEIVGLADVAGLALGAEFSCARLHTGGVRCWGRNDLGQLGTGMVGGSESSPVPVAWP